MRILVSFVHYYFLIDYRYVSISIDSFISSMFTVSPCNDRFFINSAS